jgi:sulfur carrier protein
MAASNHAPRRQTSRSAAKAADQLADGLAGRDNTGMDITLNGEPRSIAATTTVLQLLAQEGLGERRVAVEINGEIIPRSCHGQHAVAPGDCIEIVHALGGG